MTAQKSSPLHCLFYSTLHVVYIAAKLLIWLEKILAKFKYSKAQLRLTGINMRVIYRTSHTCTTQ